VTYSEPSSEDYASKNVVSCDGCGRDWPRSMAVPRLKKCVNCARDWWRAAQGVHRTGNGSTPKLRLPKPLSLAPNGMDVDAFLKTRTGVPDPIKRAPRTREEKHDPNESIDSIVSRMTASAVLEENVDEEFVDTDAS